MPTVNELIRQRLLRNVPCGEVRVGSLEEIERSEWSWEFVQLCLNRVVMGVFRYGPISGNRHAIYRPDEIIRRVKLYERTGNKEYLCDVSNLAHLEFKEPSIPNAHFAATDDGEHCNKEDL